MTHPPVDRWMERRRQCCSCLAFSFGSIASNVREGVKKDLWYPPQQKYRPKNFTFPRDDEVVKDYENGPFFEALPYLFSFSNNLNYCILQFRYAFWFPKGCFSFSWFYLFSFSNNLLHPVADLFVQIRALF